jgi:hypothetical protein
MGHTTVLKHAVALLLAAAPALAGAQLRCEDTRYHDGDPPDAFTSRYHVLQLYGDVGWRSSNFFASGYDGVVSASTARVLAPRLSELVRSRVPLPDPFVGVTVSALKGIDWENRADGMAGIEWRPLKRVDSLPVGLGWLHQVRLYAATYSAEYLRDAAAFAARPHGDVRVGAELYRECNLYSGGEAAESPFWAEVWGDVSWRRTNFVVNDFRAWTAALVPKIGVRLPPGAELALMPYVTGEVSATQRTEWWQNRALAGLGLRLMPFRHHFGPLADLLRGGRLYVEELWLVSTLKDPIPDGVPPRDLRVGGTFVINRWH